MKQPVSEINVFYNKTSWLRNKYIQLFMEHPFFLKQKLNY